jgi:hypothetical protein
LDHNYFFSLFDYNLCGRFVTLGFICNCSDPSSWASFYHLRDDTFIPKNLRGLLECGVQKSMDLEEPTGLVDPSAPLLAIETMLGYARSIGTALWYEARRDHGEVQSERSMNNLCSDLSFC